MMFPKRAGPLALLLRLQIKLLNFVMQRNAVHFQEGCRLGNIPAAEFENMLDMLPFDLAH